MWKNGVTENTVRSRKSGSQWWWEILRLGLRLDDIEQWLQKSSRTRDGSPKIAMPGEEGGSFGRGRHLRGHDDHEVK